MARDHARVNVTIWNDPDFRKLPPAAQHLYFVLWTSPTLTYAGTHDWRPGRLAKLSEGFTADHVQVVADCLSARYFLVVDTETEEALVRSWARFDGLMKQPRMAVSLATAYAAVASETIRGVLVTEVAKIRDEAPGLACWKDRRVAELLDHPAISAKDLDVPGDPFGDGVGDGFALGLPQTQGKVWGSVCTPPTPAPAPSSLLHTPTSAGSNADADDANGSESDLPGFDEFWLICPRKVGKGQAKKAYKAALRKTTPDVIASSMQAQIPELTRKGIEFCPHPATWLNGERWTDETTTRRPAEDPDAWMRRRPAK